MRQTWTVLCSSSMLVFIHLSTPGLSGLILSVSPVISYSTPMLSPPPSAPLYFLNS